MTGSEDETRKPMTNPDQQQRLLGDLLDELGRLPRDLIVQSAILKLNTEMGNVIDYRYPAAPVKRTQQNRNYAVNK